MSAKKDQSSSFSFYNDVKKDAEYYANKLFEIEEREAELSRQLNNLVEEFDKMTEDAMRQGPHGLVLVYTQSVDNELTKLIQANMPALDRDTKKALFSGTGGIATFSARIDLAKALGLIGPKLAKELHKLRKFRNMFAHADTVLSFEDTTIIDMVRGFESGPAEFRALGPKAMFSAAIGRLLSELSPHKEKAGVVQHSS